MPVMNGFDAAMEIRKLPDQRKALTPIIALTAAALYDIKATDMGSQSIMFKAEVDIDGREITRSYLEKIDIRVIFEV